MAQSTLPTSESEAADDDYSPDYETGTFPLPDDEDLTDRDEAAHTEHMAVVPEMDKYGICLGEYSVHSESGSVYDGLDRKGGSCMDAQFGNHEDGCKHYRRLILEQNKQDAAPFPEEGDEVHAYMEDRVLPLLRAFASDRERLREGRDRASDGDRAEDFTEAIEQVESFIEFLASAYEDYQETVAPETAPDHGVTY